MYEPKPSQGRRIEAAFTHHPPKNQGQIERYELIRAATRNLAMKLCVMCPDSHELNSALKTLRETQHWAIAAIACNE